MLDLIPNANVQAAATAGPAAAAPQAAVPVHGCLSIPQPIPFCSYLGDPPLPWYAWWHAFSTYLHLLEEEQGTPLSNLTKNSLLFGLLGTEGHKQFSGNPMADTRNHHFCGVPTECGHSLPASREHCLCHLGPLPSNAGSN